MIENRNSLVSLLELLEINAYNFCSLSSLLGQMIVQMEMNVRSDTMAMGASLGTLQLEARRLELNHVDKQLERLREHFISGSATTATMLPMLKDVYMRLLDSLEDRKFIAVHSNATKYYSPTAAPFGDEVANKFPSASFDIDEAGKCVALGRSTAAVFHLMRTMEIAVRSVNVCLGGSQILTGSDRNWGNILKAIREARLKKFTSSSDEGDLFSEIYGLLDATKNAWRNNTMHVEKTYTQEEAVTVYETVKSFMRKIASRLDQDGLPLA